MKREAKRYNKEDTLYKANTPNKNKKKAHVPEKREMGDNTA